MCISLPAKIIAIEGLSAEVEINSIKRRVFLSAEGAGVGDWVLVYAGTALAVVDEGSALETLRLINALENPD